MATNKQSRGGQGSSRREREPLDVRINFVVRTGDDPEDHMTILDNKEVKMVDSVFKYRDKSARFLALTLVKVAATNKKVMQEILPALKLISRGKK